MGGKSELVSKCSRFVVWTGYAPEPPGTA